MKICFEFVRWNFKKNKFKYSAHQQSNFYVKMACLNLLKLEIKTLEKIFTKNHERFRILNASVDELTCRFVGKGGKLFDIHANITVSGDFIFDPHLYFVMCTDVPCTKKQHCEKSLL